LQLVSKFPDPVNLVVNIFVLCTPVIVPSVHGITSFCATRSAKKEKKRKREGIPINQELAHPDTLRHNIIARALAHHIVYL
jgi:hypothetical protein